MDNLTLTMALLMGFTGSLHCAGMCGPIIWIMPFQAYSGLRKALGIAFYHIGRISVYAALAVVLHSFRSIFDPRVQQYVSLILGSVLLFIGVLSFVPNHMVKFKLPWTAKVQSLLGKVIGKPGLATIGLAGMFNGLLPCGLVYMALSASMAATTTPQTIAFMFVFGAGTLPMLIGITLLRSKLSFLHTQHIRKLVPVVVFTFGCLFVLRGMNLGIPYLSPKVEMAQHGGIKSSCCHKGK